MKSRWFLYLSMAICVSLIISACGGGGTSGTAGTDMASLTVVGQLQASYINGVRICVGDNTIGTQSENCNTTREQGNFTLANALGKDLAVLIDTILIGTVPSAQVTNSTIITPVVMSEGNTAKAQRIRDIFHQAGSIVNGQTYDLSAVRASDIDVGALNGFLSGNSDTLLIGNTTVRGSVISHSISGNVATVAGSALSDVTVTLSTPSATLTATTDASGNYAFTNVANGDYTITFSKSGYSFTPISATVNGANVVVPRASPTYSICGRISGAGSPMSSVTVSLSGATTKSATTDVNGGYCFSGILDGNYTLTPTLTGNTFSPAKRSVTVNSANVMGQDFSVQVAINVVNITNDPIDQFSGRILNVYATISSAYEITSVTAEVEGRSTSLTYTQKAIWPSPIIGWQPAWKGTIDLGGLKEGVKVLTVTASDAGGGTGSRTATFIFDYAPVVTVTSPIDESVATPSIRMAASCADTAGNCQSIKVYVGLSELASGTTVLNQEISLIDYPGQKISLVFEGTDSAGQKTTVTRNVYVEPSNRLAKVADVPGVVWDYSADGRILFLDTSTGGQALKIMNTAQGTVTTVFDQVGKIPKYGFLTPKGAIFMEQSGDISTSLLHDWNNGYLIDLGSLNSQTLVTKGNYASWNQGERLMLRDLLAMSNSIVNTYTGNWGNDVSENGDVVYWEAAGNGIYRYRGGATTRLTANVGLNEVLPLTDGVNVIFRRQGSSTNPPFSIGLVGASGEVLLASGLSKPPSPGSHYQVQNGWVAFTKLGTSEQFQVWIRTPGGVSEQVTFFSSSSSIVSLAPTGEVIISNGGKLYLYLTAQGLIEISSKLVKPVYVNKGWYGIIGRSIFSIDTSILLP